MKAKKNPKADLETFSKLFLLIGLVVSLLITYIALETKTRTHSNAEVISQFVFDKNQEIEIPETTIEIETPKENQIASPEPILENIKIVADDLDVKETIIESTETEAQDAVIIREYSNVKDSIEEVSIEEEVIEDVPFFIIEQVPVYPGCKGNNDELKACMEKEVKKFVTTNFNTELAQELGLSPGKQKIYVQFTIDKDGLISNIKTRAPHKSLEKEAKRVIQSLPKMKAGRQRGKPVGVKYTLPIVFEIQ